ncbi:alpha/beta fold hydrolase [Umezawaea tangerina]|uniref:Alpha-beta hydrolase superfamily lysophospholipase n=1 Tax=Umezawaea tangerina TaxID=84725 RepID=A0A2T0TCL9_9PSEU|nr:alpha/beta hydrolase [Umezawaea tangerina]PRY43378.1 alpha-beta hydrolase superfamily lysophospholipase [Umezawaea tangerina]
MQKTIHTARGVRLAVHEAGPADGPAVVLVHGWAQSGAAWAAVDGFRTFAVDLRGHGDSEEPADGYGDPTAWADDLAAVLAHVGRPAVLVGWSYGGLVVTDYLRVHGTSRVRGLVLVGAITGIGRGRAGGRIGPVMRAAVPAALADDAALAVFCAAMAPSLPAETIERLTGAALRVSPAVRAALFDRDVDNTDVLAAVDVPAVVLHGLDDGVVAPSAAEHNAAAIPGARLVLLPDTAHLPFLERPAEFAAALSTVARLAEVAG